MPFIYKITNNVNDKVYIGQTIKNPKQRFTEHKYFATHPQYNHYKNKLYCAMRKYGCENFSIETIQKCSSDRLDELEQYWIQQYDSFKNGYNNTLGGECGVRRETSEYVNLWNNGMTISQIARETNSDRKTVTDHLMGIGITNDDIQNRSKQFMKEISKMPLYQYDIDGNYVAEYQSIRIASEQTGINISSIRGVISNQHPSAGGFQWKRYKTDNVGKCPISPLKKQIHQYSLDGKYIRSFESIKEASRSMGFNGTVTIRRVLNGGAKCTGGYRWSLEKKDRLEPVKLVKRRYKS